MAPARDKARPAVTNMNGRRKLRLLAKMSAEAGAGMTNARR